MIVKGYELLKMVDDEKLERQANYSFIGIELDEEYMDIARARIEYVKNKIYNKEDEQYKQTSLFEEEI